MAVKIAQLQFHTKKIIILGEISIAKFSILLKMIAVNIL